MSNGSLQSHSLAAFFHSSLCFRTVMQFDCAVSMQTMTHSVDNVPSQQTVKLVVVGLGLVEQCWFRLFLGNQLQ